MKIKYLLYILLPAMFLFACNKQNFTGMSSLTPTSPTITVSGVSGTPYTDNDGVKTVHTITLTMSVAQVVDVVVWLNVSDSSTATSGEDFTVPASVLIPAGRTTASFDVTILNDETDESTEEFSLQIGDDRTANATLKPVTQKFVINNFTGDDLAVNLSWNPEVYDQASGELYDPTDVADMILDVYYNGILDSTIDGSDFEGFVLQGTEPDGIYTFVASYYDVMDVTSPVDMDIAFSTYQIGVAASSQDFDYAGLNTTADGKRCNLLDTLVTVEKVSTSYNVISTPAAYIPFVLSSFVANYGGVEYELYGGVAYGGNPAYIASLNTTSDTLVIDSLGQQVMINFWGETILQQTPTKVVIRHDGSLEIPTQYSMMTLYSGDTSYYNIEGVGTWNSCDYSMDIQFDLIYTDGSGALSDYADDGVLHAKLSQSKKSFTTQIPLSKLATKPKH